MNDPASDPASASLEISDLVAETEGRNLDFESKLPDVGEAAQLIAGLANSGGGRIVLGAGGQGKISGLRDAAQAETSISEAANLVVPSVNVDFATKDIGNQQVGVVEVPAIDGLVVAPNGPIVRRDEDGETRSLTESDISKALTSSKGGTDTAKQLALLNDKVDKSVKAAAEARSLKGQAPGLIGGAALGFVLSILATPIASALFG
jgi:predicted HTH transcriptional regulator